MALMTLSSFSLSLSPPFSSGPYIATYSCSSTSCSFRDGMRHLRRRRRGIAVWWKERILHRLGGGGVETTLPEGVARPAPLVAVVPGARGAIALELGADEAVIGAQATVVVARQKIADGVRGEDPAAQRFGDPLRRQRIEARRGVTDRQPVVARGRRETPRLVRPRDDRTAARRLARDRADERHCIERTAPLIDLAEAKAPRDVRIGHARDDAAAVRQRRGVPPAVGERFDERARVAAAG